MKKTLGLIGLLVLLAALCPPVTQRFAILPTSGGVNEACTLILDPGHGGFDGGAQSADGTTEQYINLCIAREVQSLCGLFGERSILTRDSEDALDFKTGRSIHENKVADIQARQRIAEEIPNGVFLSIHLNKFEQSQYYGAQTFYSRNDSRSQTIAESIQSALIEGIPNGNTRKAKPSPETVYLMKKLKCPALIVECGFLSNPDEALALREPSYQKKLALCILCGYLSA